MSANANSDAVAHQEGSGQNSGSGEFMSKIKRDQPMQTGGHQPGQMVGNDAVPEFKAETLPPGSAPAANTFKPNNVSDIPPQANMAPERADPESEQAHASDTIGGATSGDVHTGLGHPGQGQSSKELHHDGQAGNKAPGKSLEGVGATTEGFKTVDTRDPQFKDLRALDKDEAVSRGTTGGPAASEREPMGATQVATEHQGKDRQDRGT
ncbi:hypothetical protein LTR37_014713 [Vermiconidia calcicola]|uniref:Uncharacterized protein n=1 Tax=Vermiconidia calcicola TaxID=1690605 RepID=A0ACC3MSS6_9PEZI|nr:hypothetical protein LTR37_014713 [Vermiconidia calcicola]